MLDKRYDNNTLGGSALKNSAPPHERVHSQTKQKNKRLGWFDRAGAHDTTTTTLWLEIQEHHDVNDVIVDNMPSN